jgi:ribosomal protein S18 acetylase RimI-like enzyme
MYVKQLTPSDAAQYRELMLQGYEFSADAFTTTAQERLREPEAYWIKRIADPGELSTAFGAFNGQTLVGSVALEFSNKTKTRHKASVIGMYVRSEARGTGAGRALMNAAIDYALARQNIVLLNLTVTEGNEVAINLYRSLGFQLIGVEPMAILTPSGYQGKVHMWLPLAR